MRLDRDLLPKGEVRGGALGIVPERLALLRTVDAAEADTFSFVVVQDFEGVAIEEGGERACSPCEGERRLQSTSSNNNYF